MAAIHSRCERCGRMTTVTLYFHGIERGSRLCFGCKSSVIRLPNTPISRPMRIYK